MNIDEFWDIVELAQALTNRLVALASDEILDFDERFDEVRDRLEQWEMCAACLLISGYISDHTFSDFKAGVVALGREAFDRAAADPDLLAEHPAVIEIAHGGLERTALNAEQFGFVASTAFSRLHDGDDEAFWEAMQARWDARGARPQPDDWDGRFGAPGDRDLIPVRVPRLAALFPLPGASQPNSSSPDPAVPRSTDGGDSAGDAGG